MKAGVALPSLLVLLLSGCSDVVPSHYETYDQAASEGFFARGWLPDSIPSSSHDIRASNNLDRNSSEDGFSFAPETLAPFIRLLVPLSRQDAAAADVPEVVARREAAGYGSYALTSGNRVWVFSVNGADAHAYYYLWQTTERGAPPAAPAGSPEAPPGSATPRR